MRVEKTFIGRAERADFPDLKIAKVAVKIDTGADACSIWANARKLPDGSLRVHFFGGKSTAVVKSSDYSVTRIANSFGHRELRYKVKLKIRLKGRLVRATFTLSDRSQKLYPVLIGRSMLKGKFVVDVARGIPLRDAEKQRREALEEEMIEIQKEIL